MLKKIELHKKAKSNLIKQQKKSSDITNFKKVDNWLEESADACISKFDYLKKFGYPVLNIDYFFFNLINVVGNSLINENKLNSSDVKKILLNVLSFLKDFYKNCTECDDNCLNHPYQYMKFDFMDDFGIDINSIPSNMREKVKINFFYLEMLNVLSSNLNYELEKIIDSELAFNIASDIYYYSIDYISSNCLENCDNKCISFHNKNAYCEFCIMTDDRLPCPENNEISFKKIFCEKKDLMLCNDIKY